jgi:hypothetical protein
LKSIRLEIGIDLKVVISFFQESNSMSLSDIEICKDGGVAPLYCMDTYKGCVGIAALIRILDSIWSSVVSFT